MSEWYTLTSSHQKSALVPPLSASRPQPTTPSYTTSWVRASGRTFVILGGGQASRGGYLPLLPGRPPTSVPPPGVSGASTVYSSPSGKRIVCVCWRVRSWHLFTNCILKFLFVLDQVVSIRVIILRVCFCFCLCVFDIVNGRVDMYVCDN